jgi:membrane protein implicated in regulation of membrane protease activity
VAGNEEGVRGVAVAVGVAGFGMALLAWLAGGAIGSGRLSTVGASPWQVGLTVAGEIATVSLAYLGVRWLRRTREAPTEAEPELAGV